MKKRISMLGILGLLVYSQAALSQVVTYGDKKYDIESVLLQRYNDLMRIPDGDTKNAKLAAFFSRIEAIKPPKPPVAPKKKPAIAAAADMAAVAGVVPPAPVAPAMSGAAMPRVRVKLKQPAGGSLLEQIRAMRQDADVSTEPAVAPAVAVEPTVVPVAEPVRMRPAVAVRPVVAQRPAVAAKPDRPLSTVAPADVLPPKFERTLHHELMKGVQHQAANRFSRVGQEAETARVKSAVGERIRGEDDDAASRRVAQQLQAEEDARNGQVAAAAQAEPVGLLDDLRTLEAQNAQAKAMMLAKEERLVCELLAQEEQEAGNARARQAVAEEAATLALLEAEALAATHNMPAAAAAADDAEILHVVALENRAERIRALMDVYKTARLLMDSDTALTAELVAAQVLAEEDIIGRGIIRNALNFNQREVLNLHEKEAEMLENIGIWLSWQE